MKPKRRSTMILCLIAAVLLTGGIIAAVKLHLIGGYPKIKGQQLTELFQENKGDFTAVADRLWPLALEYSIFYLEDGALSGDLSDSRITDDDRAALTRCLQDMKQFIQKKYDSTNFDITIRSRVIFDNLQVIEFSFFDNQNLIDCGIVYTEEATDAYSDSLDENWYLYSFAMV